MSKLTGHLEEIGVPSHSVEEVVTLEAANARLRADLKAARHVLEMDGPRLLKCIQTIKRLIGERDEARTLARACSACEAIHHLHAEEEESEIASIGGQFPVEEEGKR